MTSLRKIYARLRFHLKSAGYMRVAYLHPRQIAVVTSRHEGKDNALPIDWHIPLSFSPRLYAICLEKDNHSQFMIRQSGYFVVNMMAAESEEKTLLLGKISGKDTDKFTAVNLGKKEALRIDCPVLKDAVGYLECRVKEIVPTGDHDLIIGEVLHEEMDDELHHKLYHITAVRKK